MIKFNWEIQLANRENCEEKKCDKPRRERVLAFVLRGTHFGKPTFLCGSFSAYCKGNRRYANVGLRKPAQARELRNNRRKLATSRRLVDAQTRREMAA
jgi:hypothetical protein